MKKMPGSSRWKPGLLKMTLEEVKTMKKRTIFVAGLAILLTAAFTWAQGPGRMRGMGPGGSGMRGMGPGNFGESCAGCNLVYNPMMARLLDLTDAQKDAIRSESNAAREQTLKLRTQLREARGQIAGAVNNAASDATLEGLAKQVGTLESEILTVSLKARSTIHNQILTAPQRAKLAEMRADRQNQRQSQRNRRLNRFKQGQPAGPPVNVPAPGPNGL